MIKFAVKIQNFNLMFMHCCGDGESKSRRDAKLYKPHRGAFALHLQRC